MSRSDVLKFVGRLMEAAENGGRTASIIEILIIQALAYHAADDTEAALESLEKAIVLAEPERYVRIFVDEGALIGPLLRLAAKQGRAPDHARRLLTAFGGVGKRAPVEGLSSFLCEVVVHVVGSRRPGKVMANALSACFHPWVPVPSSPLLLFPMLRIAK